LLQAQAERRRLDLLRLDSRDGGDDVDFLYVHAITSRGRPIGGLRVCRGQLEARVGHLDGPGTVGEVVTAPQEPGVGRSLAIDLEVDELGRVDHVVEPVDVIEAVRRAVVVGLRRDAASRR
jgi:hypothetical protein